MKALWVATLCLVGCAATPPTGWQRGGTPLQVPAARWVNGDLAVDIDDHGRVRFNGRHVMTVDRAGRAYDPYGEPIALLRRDGLLYGPDDDPLGWVGAGEAMLPGDDERWFVLAPNGEVVRYDRGGPRPFGVWLGCRHPATMQACTLVTHLMGMELRDRERLAEPQVSVGIGVGVSIGP